ncbi:MAG: hypothetical protein A2234_11545 [Elusimicrobia bacterium RIFOXYA2_FULL_58_8]|nr:MAG: hypothetical protein A2285_01735 [Elusimicrobia bacterium RIFOXYA12_FULL_57_11]OGS14288.1 MAG: hypothetical protein A2234_11545 [Elusimicrobia bacterium RIFOXYA2_FULL_58_8]
MSGKKVLVVDDDPNVGLLISAVLKKNNYIVTALADSGEVMAFLRDNKPDIILLDLRMPGIDGYALCKHVREVPDTRDIPIIILSGVSETEAKVTSIELGADDFITKPFDVRELRARVNRLIKRKNADTALNPLTRLPGSPAIEEEVLRRLADEEPFAFCYVDADNFKAYNDVYGYAKGDDVIKRISLLLAEEAKTAGGSDYFVGHVGGDDFILITSPETCEAVAKAITEKFDSVIPSFYNEEDQRRGYITTMDRKNKTRDFPLMSLTVAIVAPKTQKHYAKIVESAAELKRYAKEIPSRRGSIFVRDRRI